MKLQLKYLILTLILVLSALLLSAQQSFNPHQQKKKKCKDCIEVEQAMIQAGLLSDKKPVRKSSFRRWRKRVSNAMDYKLRRLFPSYNYPKARTALCYGWS